MGLKILKFIRTIEDQVFNLKFLPEKAPNLTEFNPPLIIDKGMGLEFSNILADNKANY